ncbi:hypothetical protein R3W88_024450 [Solanum pinnatisectum]|uniref:Retrotransposon gag domain-containing protein n=1 Tax=Solanum pinnatisectum TaxID=50273 RepID=A0AAV9M239_9SOLN|nr:hypothetical protein R3W88_024450 [Solanum pinnatisectum]
MPNIRSKGAPLVPYDPELRKTIHKIGNTKELEAQRLRFGLEAETVARGIQPNVVNCQEQAQHPAHMMFEEDDLDLDGAGATGAIMLPILLPGVKFTITSTMIQLLNLKGIFSGETGDSAKQHLRNFMVICKSQEIPGVSQTMMRLRLFSFSLTGEATNWLNEILVDSIRTWTELKEAFLERFFLK